MGIQCDNLLNTNIDLYNTEQEAKELGQMFYPENLIITTASSEHYSNNTMKRLCQQPSAPYLSTPYTPNKLGNEVLPHVRLILEVARDIRKEWKNVSGFAAPYLEAMLSMTTIDKPYGAEDAKDVIMRFLSNANYFRGAKSRVLKQELKKHRLYQVTPLKEHK